MISLLSDDDEKDIIDIIGMQKNISTEIKIDKILKKKDNILKIDKKRSFDEIESIDDDDDDKNSEDSFFANSKFNGGKKSKTTKVVKTATMQPLSSNIVNKSTKTIKVSKKEENSKLTAESNLTKFFDFDPLIHDPLLKKTQPQSSSATVKRKSTNTIVLKDDVVNDKLNTKKTVYDISSEEENIDSQHNDDSLSLSSSSSDFDSFYKETDNDDNDDNYENVYKNHDDINDIFNKNNASNDYLKRIASIDIGRNNFAIFIYDIQQNQVIFWKNCKTDLKEYNVTTYIDILERLFITFPEAELYLIEKQVAIAPKNCIIESIVHSIVRHKLKKRVLSVNPSSVSKYFSLLKTKHLKKRDAVVIVKQILIDRDAKLKFQDISLPRDFLSRQTKKRDDLADCCLQGILYFIATQRITINILFL